MNSDVAENGQNKTKLYLNFFKINEGFWTTYSTKNKLGPVN